MYSLKINGQYLYYPLDEEYIITKGSADLKVGEPGGIEITIPKQNPFYDLIQERVTEIELYQNDEWIWSGEVRETSIDFWLNKVIFTVGELAYLNDSIQPLQQYNTTRVQIFNTLISIHNSQVEEKKRFTVGIVGMESSQVMKVVTNFEGTLECIQKYLCDGAGLYCRVRRQNGIRYLDLMPLDGYGKHSEQKIELSRNLLDVAINTSTDGLATVCVPLGVQLEESPIENVTSYLTIVDVNDGKNYVESPEAISNFGRISRVVHFNAMDTPTKLKLAAETWLSQNQFEKYSYTLTAFDLSLINVDIDDYSVGDYIRCVSNAHGMDAWLPVRERIIDLIDVQNNIIKLGSESTKSFTASTLDQFDAIEEKTSDILEAAFNNAANIINTNGQNGNIVFRKDANGKLFEQLFLNADTLEQSTKAWRWNINGWGFGTKAAGASEFTWKPLIAATMDGEFNAKYITTGQMTAERIRGGILALGGDLNQSGIIEVYDKDSNTYIENTEGYNLVNLSIRKSGITQYYTREGVCSGNLFPLGLGLENIPAALCQKFTGVGMQYSVYFDMSGFDNQEAYFTLAVTFINTSNNEITIFSNSRYRCADYTSLSNYWTMYAYPWTLSNIKSLVDIKLRLVDSNGSDIRNSHVKFTFFNAAVTFSNNSSYIIPNPVPLSYTVDLDGTYNDFLNITRKLLARIDNKGIQIGDENFDAAVTRITKDSITADLINALHVKAGSVDAENITGETISGKNIIVGGRNSTTQLEVYNSRNQNVCEIGNEGLVVNNNMFKLYGFNNWINLEEYEGGSQYKWTATLGCQSISCYSYYAAEWHYKEVPWYHILNLVNTSDIRMKTNIKELSKQLSLDLIMNTKTYSFNLKDELKILSYGVMAQEVLALCEELGIQKYNKLVDIPNDPETEMYTVEYRQYIPHLINVVQELQKEIDILKDEIISLKQEIETLKGAVK